MRKLTDVERATLDGALIIGGTWSPHERFVIIDQLEPVLGDLFSMAEKRALEEVANKWQWGEWANVLLPKTDTIIESAQRVTNWLRHYAAIYKGK